MKGYNYKYLKSLVVDDQVDVGKTKKRKKVKDSSKSDLVKKPAKLVEKYVEGGGAEVEIVYQDGPEVANKGLREGNTTEVS